MDFETLQIAIDHSGTDGERIHGGASGNRATEERAVTDKGGHDDPQSAGSTQ